MSFLYQFNPEFYVIIHCYQVYWIQASSQGRIWVGAAPKVDHLDPKSGLFEPHPPQSSYKTLFWLTLCQIWGMRCTPCTPPS